MDEQLIIDQLEDLAERLGLKIRYEPIRLDEDMIVVLGGMCRLKGEPVLIINSNTALKDRIKTFIEAVRHFDLDGVYIRPVLRELLDRMPEQRRFNIIDEHEAKS